MPKMQNNDVLRQHLWTYVELHGGSASQAADALELPRVFVWRFLRTGKAIPRNVAKLKRALESVPRDLSSAPAVETRGKSKEQPREEYRFSRSDVAKMRFMLQYLIAALDAYETSDADIAPRSDRAGSPY